MVFGISALTLNSVIPGSVPLSGKPTRTVNCPRSAVRDGRALLPADQLRRVEAALLRWKGIASTTPTLFWRRLRTCPRSRPRKAMVPSVTFRPYW